MVGCHWLDNEVVKNLFPTVTSTTTVLGQKLQFVDDTVLLVVCSGLDDETFTIPGKLLRYAYCGGQGTSRQHWMRDDARSVARRLPGMIQYSKRTARRSYCS